VCDFNAVGGRFPFLKRKNVERNGRKRNFQEYSGIK
jgi:hypothetical protein